MFKAIAGMLSKLSGRDRALAPPPGPSQDEALGDMRRFIESQVAGGYMPADEIASAAVDYMSGEADEALLRREAEVMTREALVAHRAAQANWPEVTDCDRLDAAFATLEASGVISRQDFSCCGTCGATEIWDEIDAARRADRPARGYAFFHQQDTEAATEGYGICLNYGACDEGEDAAVAIGHEIVAALNAKGLVTDWEGVIERRIVVKLDWKRRSGPAGASPGLVS